MMSMQLLRLRIKQPNILTPFAENFVSPYKHTVFRGISTLIFFLYLPKFFGIINPSIRISLIFFKEIYWCNLTLTLTKVATFFEF